MSTLSAWFNYMQFVGVIRHFLLTNFRLKGIRPATIFNCFLIKHRTLTLWFFMHGQHINRNNSSKKYFLFYRLIPYYTISWLNSFQLNVKRPLCMCTHFFFFFAKRLWFLSIWRRQQITLNCFLVSLSHHIVSTSIKCI